VVDDDKGVDRGCVEGSPFCVPLENGFSNCCVPYINGQGDDSPNMGCDEDAPLCIAKYLEGGDLCAPMLFVPDSLLAYLTVELCV
jgi:hypothetical protein